MKKKSPLRILRIVLAAVFFIGITLLFVGIGQQWWGWMAKLQFLPSCLALNVGVFAGITVLTLLFGRIYCSVICPMGVFQDSVLWLRRKIQPKKKFTWSAERKILRYIVVGLFVLSLMLGIQIVIALLAPYSAYGRIVSSIVGLAEGGAAVWPLIAVAGATLVAIGLCAWLWGRAYCNSICPVGTVLSLFSRFSLFKVKIDTDKCVNCGKCAKECKAFCINAAEHKIDYTRCVDCMDCIDNCSVGAIKFGPSWGKTADKAEAPEAAENASEKTADTGRRAFIGTLGVIAGTATLKAADGGLAPVIDKQKPERAERIVPPGAGSVDSFYSHCTACQLCISACPNHVLRPSTDLEHLLQPEMGYEKGYCRPECHACSDVCPTGAISKLLEGQKLGISIGTAQVNLDLCVVNKDDVDCGNCARHCPVGAVRMVPKEGSEHLIPAVDENVCIGCGACENLCPGRPISAITVNGRSTHKVK